MPKTHITFEFDNDGNLSIDTGSFHGFTPSEIVQSAAVGLRALVDQLAEHANVKHPDLVRAMVVDAFLGDDFTVEESNRIPTDEKAQ